MDLQAILKILKVNVVVVVVVVVDDVKWSARHTQEL